MKKVFIFLFCIFSSLSFADYSNSNPSLSRYSPQNFSFITKNNSNIRNCANFKCSSLGIIPYDSKVYPLYGTGGEFVLSNNWIAVQYTGQFCGSDSDYSCSNRTTSKTIKGWMNIKTLNNFSTNTNTGDFYYDPVQFEKIVVKRIVEQRDNKWSDFIVANKQNGSLTIYNSFGDQIATTPALYGKKVGDTFNSTSSGTTPSGKFELSYANDSAAKAYGGSVIDFKQNGKFLENKAGRFSILRTYTAFPNEKRVERMNSKTPTDNRITPGSINVPPAFYDAHFENNFYVNMPLYVLPETSAGRTGIFSNEQNKNNKVITGDAETDEILNRYDVDVEEVLKRYEVDVEEELKRFDEKGKGNPATNKPYTNEFNQGLDAYTLGNYTKAAQLFEKACNANVAQGCNYLGLLYSDGQGVKQNYHKGAQLYEKACNAGEAWGCKNLGNLYAIGKVVKQDYKKANQLYEKGCNSSSAGNFSGCYHLAQSYEKGEGVKQDYKKASQLYEKACDLDKGEQLGCYRNSWLKTKLEKLKEEKKTEESEKQKRESGEDFFQQSRDAYYKGDYAKVAQLVEKACNAGEAWGCGSLGILYGNGQGVKQDYYKASQLFEKACNAGDDLGCGNLGFLFHNGQGVNQDYHKAAQLYEKACNADVAGGCNNLGNLYANGQGVRQDYQKAAQLYEKDCKFNVNWGCYNLGNSYNNGQGVRQSYSNAKEYYGKACDLGLQQGCDEYKKLNLKDIERTSSIQKTEQEDSYYSNTSTKKIKVDNVVSNKNYTHLQYQTPHKNDVEVMIFVFTILVIGGAVIWSSRKKQSKPNFNPPNNDGIKLEKYDNQIKTHSLFEFNLGKSIKSNHLLLTLLICGCITITIIPLGISLLAVFLIIRYVYLYKLWSIVSNENVAKKKVAIYICWHLGIIIFALLFGLFNGVLKHISALNSLKLIITGITLYLFFGYGKYRAKNYQLFRESYTNFVNSKNLQDAPVLIETFERYFLIPYFWSQYCVAYDYFKSKNFFN